MKLKAGNPSLKAFEKRENFPISRTGEVMTVEGAINKTALLLFLTILTAAFSWNLVLSGNIALAMPLMIAGGVGGFIIALVTFFKASWSPYTSPVYAVLEGLLLGALSAFMEMKMPGIVMQATLLTFGVFGLMLTAYKTKLIRATEKFKMGIVAATGGIAIVYLASFVLGLFGVHIPYIHEGGMIGIGFSLFVVVIAALNLILDFDFIEQAANQGAAKHMEWYAAFSLLVTLVWLYIEILRLLSKLNRD